MPEENLKNVVEEFKEELFHSIGMGMVKFKDTDDKDWLKMQELIHKNVCNTINYFVKVSLTK